MKALHRNDSISYSEDFPLPEIHGDEVLVRVSCAGICATDLEIARGYMGFSGIPGHEFVGRAAAPADSA